MDRLLTVIAAALGFLVAACFFMGAVLGFVVWLWSMVIAWSVGGVGGTIATAILPPFAQLYWAFRVGNAVDWFAPYCIAVWLLIATTVIKYLLGIPMMMILERRNR